MIKFNSIQFCINHNMLPNRTHSFPYQYLYFIRNFGPFILTSKQMIFSQSKNIVFQNCYQSNFQKINEHKIMLADKNVSINHTIFQINSTYSTQIINKLYYPNIMQAPYHQTDQKKKKIKHRIGNFQSYLNRQKCLKAMELFDLNVPIRHIVRQLEIAEKTIRKIKNQYLFFGSIQPYKGYMKRYGRSAKELQQDEIAKRQVQKLLKQNCSHTMGSLKRALEARGINKQVPTLYKYLHELKYTRKKIRKVQLQRNTREKLQYRQKYCEMISKIPIQNQIFLDETTFYQNTTKQFGWAPVGQSAYIHIPANQKKHVTLLAAVSARGFEATKIIVGKFRCKHILQFIEHYLDHIQPHEVLVLDNARYHHSVLVKQKLQQLNRPVRYLPAYSPQLNPIERVFGSIKRRFKKWRSLVEMSVPEMNELIEKCVQDVATKDFREYFDEYEEWIKKGIEGQFFV